MAPLIPLRAISLLKIKPHYICPYSYLFLAIFPARNKKKPPKQVTNNKLVQNWLCGVTMEQIWSNNIAWKVDKLGFQMALFYPWLSELSFAGAIFLDFLNHFFGSLWGYTKPLWWNFGCVREKIRTLVAYRCEREESLFRRCASETLEIKENFSSVLIAVTRMPLSRALEWAPTWYVWVSTPKPFNGQPTMVWHVSFLKNDVIK